MTHKLQIFGQMRRGRPQSKRLPKAPEGRSKLITGLIAPLRAGRCVLEERGCGHHPCCQGLTSLASGLGGTPVSILPHGHLFFTFVCAQAHAQTYTPRSLTLSS